MKALHAVPALAVAAIVALASAPAAAGSADAGVGIHRCEAANGTAIYTDKSCGAMRARASALSGELMTRLAMDARPSGEFTLANASLANASFASMESSMPGAPSTGRLSTGRLSTGMFRDASEPLHRHLPGRRSLGSGCARSPAQLSRDLLGSFALGDVNRVAESYHWIGLDHRQAMPVMKQLQQLAARPLADARFLAAWIGPGDLDPEAVPHDAGLMQLVFATGGNVIALQVRRYAGCYFVRF